jgi:hypothetical protein
MQQTTPRLRGAWTAPALRAIGALFLAVSVIPAVDLVFRASGAAGPLLGLVPVALGFGVFTICDALAAVVEHLIELRGQRESDERPPQALRR